MTDIFLSFLAISISTSVIIVLLLLLTPFLNKRYAIKWKYWIWIVLALRLIVPGGNVWQSVAGIQSEREIPASSESEKTPLESLVERTARRRVIVEIPAQMTAPIAVQPENEDSRISLLNIMAFVWMLGGLLFLSVHLISYFHCRHQIHKKGRAVKDRDILCLLMKLKRELHIKCKVPVMEYSEAASPMLIGFFNRLLVLPEEQNSLGEEYSQEEWFFILKHELIHLKRGDMYFKLLFVAANAIHWFNPLVWIMQKEAAVDMELSCDERVTKGTDYSTRKAYTETLLSTLHKRRASGTALSTEFYGGKQIMKKRFKNILIKTVKKNGVAVLICAVLLTVGLGTLVGCSIGGENPEDGAEPPGIEDMAGHSAADTETQTVPSSTERETQPVPSSTEGKLQDAESEVDLMYGDPVFLEDYYNTPDGKAAIEADYEDLAGEGMSVTIAVVMDEIIVTVKYEDSALLTEGIGETLAQQLDSMTDRFWNRTIAYDEFITWRCVLTVRYTDPEGNVLAEQSYSAE